MALAPLAHVLWSQVMSYDPSDPDWPDRDRFVLSCGHACILLYSMLYLTGYGGGAGGPAPVPAVAQPDPRPPRGARPARHRGDHRPARAGLRQRGRARAWPSACCEPGSAPDVVDHYTFVICSDGDLMEGISHEAASLAGHLGPGPAHLRLRRQPHHHRRPDRAHPLGRRRPCASRPTAGTSTGSARSPTTPPPSTTPCAGPRPSRTAPAC